jgi:hypothetical protein
VLRKNGIRLVFVMVSEHTLKELDRFGISELVGRDAFYDSGDALIAAYRQRKTDGS